MDFEQFILPFMVRSLASFFCSAWICFFVSFVGLNELWLGEPCVNQASKRLIAVVGDFFFRLRLFSTYLTKKTWL